MSGQSDLDPNENFEEMLAMHEANAPKLHSGQKISGKIIAISGDSVFVDVGVKQDGVLDRAEILDDAGNEMAEQGDTVNAFIVGISPQGIRLSRSMIGSGFAALEEARDAGVPVEGRVKGLCKGGYEVEVLGKSAFCPGSQMENVGDPETLPSSQMQFLISRIENHGRNIVVSRRALIEREHKENLDNLLANLNIGDMVEGKVARLAPYGAFVELAPSVDGLVHISELSWSRIGSPDEAVSVGEPVKVKVMSIVNDDKGQTRIGLSIKQAQGDPWEGAETRFKSDDIVEGIVRRLAPFGAFVEIAPGLEGLAHISELSWERRIAKPEEILAVGDVVSVKIKEINPETRRLSLSLKDAQGDPWLDAPDKFTPGTRLTGRIESRNQHGLFVSLAPGISGLLPMGVISNAVNASQLAKLAPGENIEVTVRSIDPESRRISLNPAGNEADEQLEEDKNWRQHFSARPEKADLGIMAQALKKAFEKH